MQTNSYYDQNNLFVKKFLFCLKNAIKKLWKILRLV